MNNNVFSISFIYILLSFILFYPSICSASSIKTSESIISLPIEADLKVLEDHLNDIVPQTLVQINEPSRVCGEAKYLKTKGIPRCRRDGYKISCKSQQIKIKVLPKIYCHIKGWIKRDGPILLSGKEKTLTFSFPIKAQVSTEAGIRETARASAVLTIHATPSIDKNWSISVDVTPQLTWSNQPTINLLNIVDLNIKNSVEPQLRKKIDLFIKKIPKLLAKLEIKEKIHSAWENIQEPIKIDRNSNTYFLFKPISASYSGFTIVNNILKATISAKGSTEIIVGNPTLNCKKTTLCKLNHIPHKQGTFHFNVPVSFSYKELLALSNTKFSNGYTIDMIKSSIPGILNISNPKIRKNNDGNISISAHITYDNRSPWLKAIDFFDWFDIDGEITFKGSPRIEKKRRYLVLDNLVYDSNTSSNLFDTVINVAELQAIKSHFSNLIHYAFGSKIDKHVIKANRALKQLSKGNINMSASLEVASIEDIHLQEEYIIIHTKLSGTVNANVGL